MLLVVTCACALGAAPTTKPTTQPIETIDGSALPAEQRFGQQEFVRRWRPWELSDHKGTLLIQNLRIKNVLNQRAMDIALSSMDRPTPTPGEPLTFSRVIIRNCETADVQRDETGRQLQLHLNHIRITGGGDAQPFETELLLEDVHIHGGDALPLLIGEGKFGRITLRRVKIENDHSSVAQITAVAAGSVRDIVIEDSPGLKLTLIGRPGTIKRCIVKNSPDAVVFDSATAIGKSGAIIVDGDETAATETAASDTTVTETTATAATATPAKIPTTKPAQKLPPPRLVVASSGDGKSIDLSLDGQLGSDAAYVTFEAYDRNDYRVCQPVVVTESPWRAKITPSRKGAITLRAIITRLGGDPDPAIVEKISIP